MIRQNCRGEACLAPTKTATLLKIFGATLVPPIRKQQDMKFDPEKHHRRSIRLKDYDFAQEGAYFVTILVKDRECLCGPVVVGEIHLSKIGQIVKDCWEKIPRHFPNVEVDAYVIMPNHIHGIIVIGDVGARHASPLQ